MMKLWSISICLFLGTGQAFSQNEKAAADWETVRHHEIGLDATGFIKKFTNITGESDFQYPIYQFTYRYKMNVGNIRFGAGGLYAENEFQNLYYGDSTIRKRFTKTLNLRLGWEFKTDISKRWQAFYGVDFRASYGQFRDDNYTYEYQYSLGREYNTETIGIAPLLGFRFKITPRLSLTTEANFSISMTKSKETIKYIPLNDYVPIVEDKELDELKSINGYFDAPLSVILTFDI
ncbi:hypothetical protein DNU06_04565 [Putridiphycobacter roseus]|uniref:DUF481 domain-containing protein n=1 Tax=Putridiphycobacter roseus TaxID=2219161 RepID=A0A2W1NEM7_9FLAO|nr:hypothetical protein [Putridiphycobacter roseus]PZE17895.1 hypothetical protein DNU06_04565 [Putridiphycobacter roseus]